MYKLNRINIINQLHINNISAHTVTSNLIVIEDSCKVSNYIMNNIIYLPIHHLTNKRNIDIVKKEYISLIIENMSDIISSSYLLNVVSNSICNLYSGDI